MSRQVRAVVLCEDLAHWHFARAFLLVCGWNGRQLISRIAPTAKGAAEQWVRDTFPEELFTYRPEAGERVSLIVVIDGDRHGAPVPSLPKCSRAIARITGRSQMPRQP